MPSLPSFSRFLENAFPNLVNDGPRDVDMTPSQMDGLLSFQRACPDPRYLEQEALLLAGVVDHEKVGKKLFAACVKHGYIVPRPGSELDSRGPSTSAGTHSPITVNTSLIDKNLPNRLAFITLKAQRKLISLLFFWEEECTRWRKLDEEERTLLEELQLADAVQARELQTMLESVRRRRDLLPSQRAEGAGGVFPPKDEELPVYPGRGGQ